MTTTTIIRAADGAVLNIGPWDYRTATVQEPVLDGEGQPVIDDQGEPVMQDVIVQHNPLPEGAYEDQAEVGTREDGSRYVIEAGE